MAVLMNSYIYVYMYYVIYMYIYTNTFFPLNLALPDRFPEVLMHRS